MFVLSRKIGEKVVINDNITIMLVDIESGKVRIGVDAAREIPVVREELLTRDENGNRARDSGGFHTRA